MVLSSSSTPQVLLPAQVDAELRTMLVRQDAEPPKTLAVRMWPQAIPQFNLGHLRTVQVQSWLVAPG